MYIILLLLSLFNTINAQYYSATTPTTFDCIVSKWDSWQPCTNGIAIRYRTVVQPAIYNGVPCPPLNETRPCPVDCQVTSWSQWTECVNGTQTRVRSISRFAMNNGRECPSLSETRICPTCNVINGTRYCSVSCKVSNWSSWSNCDNGTMYRTRTVVRSPLYNGTECPPLIQFDDCVTYCNVTKWEPWTQCVNGIKTRTRSLYNLTQENCTQPYLFESANCSQNCIVTGWTNITNCINGVITMSRSIIQYPSNGGLECPPLTTTIECSSGGSGKYSKETILALSLGLGIPLFICLDILFAILLIKYLRNRQENNQNATV